MSYARWGPDSAVYVFADSRGGIVCCGCNLHVSIETHTWTDFFGTKHVAGEPSLVGDDQRFYDVGSLIAHLQEHAAAGQSVPAELFNEATYDPSDFLPLADGA